MTASKRFCPTPRNGCRSSEATRKGGSGGRNHNSDRLDTEMVGTEATYSRGTLHVSTVSCWSIRTCEGRDEEGVAKLRGEVAVLGDVLRYCP